jgi:hypothetical protein
VHRAIEFVDDHRRFDAVLLAALARVLQLLLPVAVLCVVLAGMGFADVDREELEAFVVVLAL